MEREVLVRAHGLGCTRQSATEIAQELGISEPTVLAADRRGHLGIDLIGRDLDEGLVFLDRVAGLL